MPAARRTADSAPSAPTTSPARNSRPSAEPDADGVARRLERRELGAEQHDAERLGARGERGLDRAVLADVAEVGLAELGGIEHERIRAVRLLALFPDDHAPVGRGARGDGRPGAGALEQLLRGARQRGHAHVERRIGRGQGRGPRLDERDAQGRPSQASRRGAPPLPAPAMAPPTTTTSKSRFMPGGPGAAGRAPGAAGARRDPWCAARTRA